MMWKTKARLSAAAYLAGLFVAANLGHGASASPDAKPFQLPVTQTALMEAETRAREKLGLFLSNVLSAEGVAHETAAVKIAPPDGNEPIWIMPFASLGGGQFVGIIANETGDPALAQAGDATHFRTEDIRDWSFIGTDDKLYGSYTTRILLPHLSRVQAERIGNFLSEQPVPANW